MRSQALLRKRRKRPIAEIFAVEAIELIDIAKKKMPLPAVIILLYLSYCAACWFYMRGTLAFYTSKAQVPRWVAHDAIAFIAGGAVPTLVFWFGAAFAFKTLPATVGGDVKSLRYGLNLTVIAANIFLFGFKFTYIAMPLVATIVDILIDPFVTLAFVALYLWYAFYRNYVDKTRYRIVVRQVFCTFAAFYGVVALLNIIMSAS